MPAGTFIPYGLYWSTPFAKWQGSLSHLHSLRYAAHVATGVLARRGVDSGILDYAVLGTTVPQRNAFYGLPWVTGMLGAPHVGGPTVNQACATSARIVQMAAQEVSGGQAGCALVIAADRCSNGPHLYYPAPSGPGGTGEHEDWVLDNFGHDPYAGNAMLDTAENVAARFGIGTAEQHDLVLMRYAQYQDALADNRAFQRRYMDALTEVPDARFRKTAARMEGDEGVFASTAAGLAALKPVKAGGTVTFGGQTHPADGNAGLIVATREKARDLSTDKGIEVELLGFGMARAEKGFMPLAPVPAARRALADAGIGIDQVTAVKSHNPFAVNDIAFARETGFPLERMNAFGCSLIWGHPQGPTGLRAIIELIEELALRGGGIGLFQGCAAGDTGMSLVLRVGEARA
ncbi:MAG: hypothetical protein RLY86_520 [Pseudomonadota bacterium]|jgi:acetyl-CoA acetyltransferase